METVSIFADIIACMISFTINVWVLSSFLSAKRKIHWFEYLLFGTVFVFITHYVMFSNTVASLLGMVICLLFSFIYYQGNTIKKFIIILGINISAIITGIISMEIFSLINGTDISSLLASDSIIRLLELLFMKMLCILLAYVATRVPSRHNDLSRENALIVTIFYICFFSVVLFSFIICIRVSMPPSLQLMFLALNTLMFALNVLLLFLVKRLGIQSKLQMENMVLKTQLKEQTHAVKSVEENYLQICSIRHDIKDYLTSYLLLLEDGRFDSVKEDIQKMLQQRLHTDMNFYTSNQLLNAVFNEQYRICEEKGISCQIRVDLKEETDLIEFSVIVFNLFHNAIEAEQKLPADERMISLNLAQSVSSLHLLLKNHIRDSVLKNNPNLSTTKDFSRDHGFGLHSVQKLVNENQGCMEIFEENNYFVVQIMYPLEYENNLNGEVSCDKNYCM